MELIELARSFHFVQLNVDPEELVRATVVGPAEQHQPVHPLVVSILCYIPLMTPWTGVAECRVATRFTVLSHMSFRMNYNSINVPDNLRAYIMLAN